MNFLAMRDHVLETSAFVALADFARRRGQPDGADRFLILAGLAALRAGHPAIAARCRELALRDNPQHLVARWPTLADALRDADFVPYRRRLDRFCTFERAEHLLDELGLAADAVTQGAESSEAALLDALSDARWSMP